MDMDEIRVKSTIDGSEEPSLLWLPDGPGPHPLVVGLHTWSFDRFNQVEHLLARCQARSWGLLLPEARGANLTSNPRAAQAGGSPLARRDVLDAITAVRAGGRVDLRRIWLLGGSGGGHLSLMVAADAPQLFAAVSSWVPITDLAAWHGENPHYAPHIAACCGGAPGASAAVEREYRERSPLFRVDDLLQARLAVHHGRDDASVPWTHTWRLAQAMATAGARRFYHEIFDGGHDIGYDRALGWFGGAGGGTGLTR